MMEQWQRGLIAVAEEMTPAQRRALRRIFLEHRDKAVDYFSEAILSTVLQLGEEWWLNIPIAEALGEKKST